MATNYFNLVVDEEGLFDSEKVLVISSGKDFLSDNYDKTLVDMLPKEFKLKNECMCVFSYDDENIEESQLLFELKAKGFVKSELLQVYENDEDEEIVVKKEESVTPSVEGFACPVCGHVHSQKDLRDLKYVGGSFLCDECGEEIHEDIIFDAIKLESDEFLCRMCGIVGKKDDLVKEEDSFYCPRCEADVEIIEEVEEESVATSSSAEETEETTTTTTTATTASTASTPTSTPTPTVPVKTVSIKDWKDLVGNINLAYSFLKNYVTIGKKGYNEPFITKGNMIKNSELLQVLENNGVITKEYRTDYISKYYTEDAILNSMKSGSIDGVNSIILIAMGCSSQVAANLSTVYAADADKFNDLYLYWNALMMAADVNYSKTIMKNAMGAIDKELKTTKPLFSFEELEVPEETRDFVIKYSESQTENATSGILEDENAEFVWSIVDIPNGPIFTKYICIKNTVSGEISATDVIVKALSVRGVDVSTHPYYKLPAYVTMDNVDLLLAGIPNLRKASEAELETIKNPSCSCGASGITEASTEELVKIVGPYLSKLSKLAGGSVVGIPEEESEEESEEEYEDEWDEEFEEEDYDV